MLGVARQSGVVRALAGDSAQEIRTLTKHNWLTGLALVALLAGCTGSGPGAPGQSLALRPGGTPPPNPGGTAAATPSAIATNPAKSSGEDPGIKCMDGALFVKDVSIPDGTDVGPGQTFRKTWRLRNTGSCTWDSAYQLVFVSGDRLGAPGSVPLAVTPPGGTLDLSVDLSAPPGRGSFAGLFELRNPAGQTFPVGQWKNIWFSISVGGGPALPGPALTAGAKNPPAPTNHHGENCDYSENGAYVQQLADLINAARRDAELPAYQWDSRLASAAQSHSQDMGCHNFLNHTGSDGSWIGERLGTAGYSTHDYSEIIAIGQPEDAMNQWRNSPSHWDSVLDGSLTEFGIGYVYVADSDYGGYFTVDIARP
jgi:uncharacterized protein YkwD